MLNDTLTINASFFVLFFSFFFGLLLTNGSFYIKETGLFLAIADRATETTQVYLQ